MNELTFATEFNSIYLNRNTSAQVNLVVKEIAQYSSQIDYLLNRTLSSEVKNKVEHIRTELSKIENPAATKIRPLQNQLIEEFRILLKSQ